MVLEKTLESPLDYKEIKPVNPKGNQPWILIGRNDAEAETPNTLVTWCEEPTHWERPWGWERLRAKGEEGSRGWDGWMTSLIQWTWILGKLQEIVKDREAWHAAVHGVGQDLGTERQHPTKVLNGLELFSCFCYLQVAQEVSGANFHGGSDGKESACSAGGQGLIHGLGRSPGEGNGNPLQYSCLENPLDGGDWQATVHEVAKSRTRLSNFTGGIWWLKACNMAQAGLQFLGATSCIENQITQQRAERVLGEVPGDAR